MLLFYAKCFKMFGNSLKYFNALIVLMIYTSIYGNLLCFSRLLIFSNKMLLFVNSLMLYPFPSAYIRVKEMRHERSSAWNYA